MMGQLMMGQLPGRLRRGLRCGSPSPLPPTAASARYGRCAEVGFPFVHSLCELCALWFAGTPGPRSAAGPPPAAARGGSRPGDGPSPLRWSVLGGQQAAEGTLRGGTGAPSDADRRLSGGTAGSGCSPALPAARRRRPAEGLPPQLRAGRAGWDAPAPCAASGGAGTDARARRSQPWRWIVTQDGSWRFDGVIDDPTQAALRGPHRHPHRHQHR
eukprot:gene1820-biopygen13353